ncbi:aminoglycoside adenylyltransferase domain-containing protein [Dictyobacter aurantiacus]|uniref:Adenylyltransferase AadA C-terminal domain-containing protein n=1 Tax=Dictyobacter aurantiacus TaxID=1936993 RepID=A0A401ZM57_9CHLR|nr:aminoglycoside adenylyltransferase domain-containing protein [Dictyobacter aurantiacus]GCE07951.1 hypothetical protein KDAU_52800 [Dictyobacter aurantiacus]
MTGKQDTRLQALPMDVQSYASQVVQVLHSYLQEGLLGVYLVGSAALGGFVPGRSDLDIQGVCARHLRQEEKEQLAALLAHPALPCPTRGCELVIYQKDAIAASTSTVGFELNLNSGPQMPLHVTYDAKDESPHWFFFDRAIAREHGIALFGPPPQNLFGVIPRAWLIEAVLISLRWYTDYDETGYASVLNACRGWCFVEENQVRSKKDAVAWATTRVDEGGLLRQALALHAGTTDEKLDAARVRRLLDMIQRRVEQVWQEEVWKK